MRIRITVPRKHITESTLGAALEASTQVAQKQVEDGNVPPIEDAINNGQVKWKPEPADQGFEGFDLPEDVMKRGWGDCDDLAAWRAGELRATGEDPDAKATVYQSGRIATTRSSRAVTARKKIRRAGQGWANPDRLSP